MIEDRVRFFLALELSIPVVESLVLLQEELADPLAQLGCEARWTPAEQIRFLVRALPEEAPDLVSRLRDPLRVITRNTAPIEIEAYGTAFLPAENLPRMLMVGLRDGLDRVDALRRQIDTALEQLGVRPDDREPVDGVLVARIHANRRPDLRGVLNAFRQTVYGRSRVSELVLVGSKRRGDLASVDVVERFAFGTGK